VFDGPVFAFADQCGAAEKDRQQGQVLLLRTVKSWLRLGNAL
jgi:hypothetical protein